VVVGGGAAADAVHARFASFAPGRVRFVGTQPPAIVAALLAGADLFVWPAVAEVIGLALLEAQACGVPVVAGRRPGVAAIVADGLTGRLTPPGDTAAFAAAVGALLDDPARRTAMGRRARAHVREHHDLASAARALGAVLARVTAAHEAAR
jgi:glycosyltransferase involved in cell wall biosynthesis